MLLSHWVEVLANVVEDTAQRRGEDAGSVPVEVMLESSDHAPALKTVIEECLADPTRRAELRRMLEQTWPPLAG